tara:strand:- start:1016 stop:1663 length:648 start_codon:yes stop_codon:yes gene_type:complete
MNDKEKQERLLEMMREEQELRNLGKHTSKAPPKIGKVGLSRNKTFLYSTTSIIITFVLIFLLGIFDNRDSKLRELSETLVNVEIFEITASLKNVVKILKTGVEKNSEKDYISNGVLRIGNGRWIKQDEGHWECYINKNDFFSVYKTIDAEGTEKVKNYMELCHQELIDRGITSEELERFKKDHFYGLVRDDPRWDGLFDDARYPPIRTTEDPILK